MQGRVPVLKIGCQQWSGSIPILSVSHASDRFVRGYTNSNKKPIWSANRPGSAQFAKLLEPVKACGSRPLLSAHAVRSGRTLEPSKLRQKSSILLRGTFHRTIQCHMTEIILTSLILALTQACVSVPTAMPTDTYHVRGLQSDAETNLWLCRLSDSDTLTCKNVQELP